MDGERIESYIAPGSDHPMRRLDRLGRTRHWILEVHLVDRERGIGGFCEQLLTLDAAGCDAGPAPTAGRGRCEEVVTAGDGEDMTS